MRTKLVKMLPYLAIPALLFYLLPLMIRDTGSAMAVLLAALPLGCVMVSLFYGWKNGFQWMYPMFIALLFVPTVFIYYNDSAWGYVLAYGILSLAGNAIGAWIGKLKKKAGQ